MDICYGGHFFDYRVYVLAKIYLLIALSVETPAPQRLLASLFRCNLLKRLASNRWGADFSSLRTSALALCYSVAEYCSPVWSQNQHCKKVDTSLNECLRFVSGCIKSYPANSQWNRAFRYQKRQKHPGAPQTCANDGSYAKQCLEQPFVE